MSEHEPMTKDEVDAIRTREAAASPGPWARDVIEIGGAPCTTNKVRAADCSLPFGGMVADVWPGNDAAFIAHARTDIPRLLADNDRLLDVADEAWRRLNEAQGECDRLRVGRAALADCNERAAVEIMKLRADLAGAQSQVSALIAERDRA